MRGVVASLPYPLEKLRQARYEANENERKKTINNAHEQVRSSPSTKAGSTYYLSYHGGNNERRKQKYNENLKTKPSVLDGSVLDGDV